MKLAALVVIATVTLATRVAEAVCTGGAPNGVVAVTESCDDGNAVATDGCNNQCEIVGEHSCARAFSFAALDVEDFPGAASSWNAAPGNQSAIQANNTAAPTVALVGQDAMRGSYVVRLEVLTATDDDFLGLVLGFAPGDPTDPNASYLVLDWKQAPQSGVSPGLRLAHVRGTVNAGNHADHAIPQRACANPLTSCVTELAAGRRFGATGWTDQTPVEAIVTYRADRLEIRIDNILEFEVSPGDFPGQFPGNVFPAGQLGFYVLSQEQVEVTNLAPGGASVCNLTSLDPATLVRALGTPNAVISTAAQLDDADDDLDPASVVVTGVTGGTAVVTPGGNVRFTPTDPDVAGTYTVTVFACDDDPVIPDCDEATFTIIYARDLDGDGIVDPIDLDDDGDGIPDALEEGRDTDGDGRTDDEDLDSDNDGLPDAAEAGHGAADADRDGLIDCPGGAGANGWCDALETFPDSGEPSFTLADGDGEGIPDLRDLDADGDGIGDRAENGTACDDDPIDGVCDGNDPDRDGVPASADGAAGFGTSYGVPPDTDGDGVPDYLDLDSDGDGLFDVDEAGFGDADDDGRVDGDDSDGDGVADPADDSDLDGIPDSLDADQGFGGVGAGLDSDGDGTPDQRDLDADGDGVPDADEAGADPADPVDTDGDDTPDFQDPDSDDDTHDDGVDNCRLIVNPDQLDTDRDGQGDACDDDDNGDGLPDDLGVQGGGCASSEPPGAALALLLGLLVLRRRRGVAIVASLVLIGGAAQAQSVATAYPAERFQLTSHRDGILGVEWADVAGHLTVDLGLWLGYADDPVNLYRTADGERVASLVSRRVGGDLVAAIRLRDLVELQLGAPLIVAQADDLGTLMTTGELTGFGLGDLRAGIKVTVARRAPFSVAVKASATLPTATSDDYAGDGGATFAPEVIGSYGRAVGLRASLSIGYRFREQTRVLDLVVDDEMFGGLGVGYRWPSSFGLDGSLDVATGADDLGGAFNRNFAELRGGAGYDLARAVRVFVAAGVGIAEGFGTPDWRALLGVRLDPRARGPRIVHGDPDGDGLVGAADRCPDLPETFDGFEDGDGCPDDPDPDGDGITGLLDGCPFAPEDRDTFLDSDGCPDPDNDQDGVLDLADRCRDEPGTVDNHGCPDPDRDQDAVVDRLDACPDAAGPPALDGCPDRDGDAVADVRDNCPDEAGTPEHQGCKTSQLVRIGDGKLELLDIVYFATDRAAIQGRSFKVLDDVARVLAAHPELTRIEVEGHTDDQGDDGYNKKLSQRRAEAVVAYLVARRVAKDRLHAIGYGEERPKVANDSAERRAINRRVEFTLGGSPGVEVRPTSP